MSRLNDEQMNELKEEWAGGSQFIFRDDAHKFDRVEINKWIINLLEEKTRSNEDDFIISLIYHSLNFDIPFPATAGMRRDLLHMVRMKIKDPNWMRFQDDIDTFTPI